MAVVAPYPTELARALWLFETSNGGGLPASSTDAFTVNQVAASSALYNGYQFKVGKRTTPSLSAVFAGGTGATFVVGRSGFYQNSNHSIPSTFGWTADADL